MKTLVNIVLFLFVSFLAAPTMVSLIEDDADVSIVYSLTEEELQKELKEVKVSPQLVLHLAFLHLLINPPRSNRVISANMTMFPGIYARLLPKLYKYH